MPVKKIPPPPKERLPGSQSQSQRETKETAAPVGHAYGEVGRDLR
jgi:hypothetical protein